MMLTGALSSSRYASQARWQQKGSCCVITLPRQRVVLVRSSKHDQNHASDAQLQQLPALEPLDDRYEERHAFSEYSNWLVPGHVMLGRYPFVEPSRCLSREQGEQQLMRILKSGISTFVCLQEELPPQEQLKLSGKAGFLPYKPTAELIQASLNGPPPREIIDGLRNPTNDQWLPSNKRHELQYHPKKLQFLHSPIVDLGLPRTDVLHSLLAELQRRLKAGEKLYIHCWGGRGRAGTVGACLLASAYGVEVEEALQRVQRAYATRRDVQMLSPETPEQFAFVREYAKTKLTRL